MGCGSAKFKGVLSFGNGFLAEVQAKRAQDVSAKNRPVVYGILRHGLHIPSVKGR